MIIQERRKFLKILISVVSFAVFFKFFTELFYLSLKNDQKDISTSHKIIIHQDGWLFI